MHIKNTNVLGCNFTIKSGGAMKSRNFTCTLCPNLDQSCQTGIIPGSISPVTRHHINIYQSLPTTYPLFFVGLFKTSAAVMILSLMQYCFIF